MRSRQPGGRERGEGGRGAGETEQLRNGQVSGEGEDLGRATAREWRRPPPSSSCTKIHLIGNQAKGDDRRRSKKQGGGGGEKMDMEGLTAGKPPRSRQGPGRRPRAARGGGKRTRDMETEAGTRRGAQRQVEEASGWRVWENSIWKTYHVGRGGGERVYREQGDY